MVYISEFICVAHFIFLHQLYIVQCFEGGIKPKNNVQLATQNMKIKESDDICRSSIINSTLHAAYKYLEKNTISLKNQCGDLCEMNKFTLVKRISSENLFDHIEKNINCEGIWNEAMFGDAVRFEYPPQKLPKYLQSFFSYDGLVDIKPNYYDNYYMMMENHTRNAWGNNNVCL